MFNRLIPMLRKIPALEHFTDKEIRSILDNVDSNIVNYESKQTIVRESEIDNNIYIILEGRVEHFIYNHVANRDKLIDESHAGDILGSVDLSKRLDYESTSAIRTVDKTTVFKIDRILLANYLKKLIVSRHKIATSKSDDKINIVKTLVKTGLFEKVDPHELSAIADRVEIIKAYEGNLILKEGVAGDFLFIIMKGEVDVFTVNKKNNLCVLAHLGSGDYFGEQAMLDGDRGKHNASVMVTATSKLIKIPKLIFRNILKKNNDLYFELNKKKIVQKITNEQALSENV